MTSTAKDRELRLEYAFRNLTGVVPVFTFPTAPQLRQWLKRLEKSEIAHHFLGVCLNKNSLNILVKLSRQVYACGIDVENTCKIWCRLGFRELAKFDRCARKIREHAKK